MKVVFSAAASLLASAAAVATAAVLSDCDGGCAGGGICVGNPHSQPVYDGDCSACESGSDVWPCNFETLCYCWDPSSGPRIPPAPSSGVPPSEDEAAAAGGPCVDLLTEGAFLAMAPDARPPYTYSGLCDAVDDYNMWHEEKAFGMGSRGRRLAELAAFLGTAMTETGGLAMPRDELPCGDVRTAEGGGAYCKPCAEGHFDEDSRTCSRGVLSGGGSYSDHCSAELTPPQGCACGPATEAESASSGGELVGYMDANDAYFGRGAIRLSSNRDYIGMSIALTGAEDKFCAEPDLLSTVGRHAWGAGVYYWMERMEFGTTGSTCHEEALGGRFGGVVSNLHGELECPANPNVSREHDEMVKVRLNDYCRAADAVGVTSLLSFDGCDGLTGEFEACLASGECPDCAAFAGAVTMPTTTTGAPPKTPVNGVPVNEDEAPNFEEAPDWFTSGVSSSTTATLQIGVAVTALLLALIRQV